MKLIADTIILSAQDLVGHLNCQTLTQLDIEVAHQARAKPSHWDPLLDILRERGLRHEKAFLEHLRANGSAITTVPGVDIDDVSVEQTIKTMRNGDAFIAQAALRHERWVGRADILVRVEKPSALGSWSYEIIDTKLAQETKGSTVLQLCLYAELLSSMQGATPEHVYVVTPWSDFSRQAFRVADYSAFFRMVMKATEDATCTSDSALSYPDPKAHCDVCRWSDECDGKRRDDDHLCLVANITKTQITELHEHGIYTTKNFSELTSPFPWKPKRGSLESFEKSRAQATIQVAARETNEQMFELLEFLPNTGFALLPTPCPGDVFFDIEGDPFIGEAGLEYLFGYIYHSEQGDVRRVEEWAVTRAEEKSIFESFVDFITNRRLKFPNMHIYHYAPYEPSALKRLMGRYATREAEIDNLLRENVFVDLYSVVRNAIRASIESYSIKKLEPFYGFQRQTTLKDANIALTALTAELELNEAQTIADDIKATVARYNHDDCASTKALRDWLEELRAEAVGNGIPIERPEAVQQEVNTDISEHEARISALIEALCQDVPIEIENRTSEQHGRWVLAHILDWHRREEKAVWWEYFRLRNLHPDDMVDEKAGLAGLQFSQTIERSGRGIPTDRYLFTGQDSDIRVGDDLYLTDGNRFGRVEAISYDQLAIDIKKSTNTANIHPASLFSHTVIRTPEQVGALLRLGEYVAQNGIIGDGDFKAARDLLLRCFPTQNGEVLQGASETVLEAAVRLTSELTSGILPIQGPPGTGKSYTGANMILRLISEGKKVGITSNSHKVIRNLIDKAVELALSSNVTLQAAQRMSSNETATDSVLIFTDNKKAAKALNEQEVQLMGGTSFFWSRADLANRVDVLIVDEAAQMSLANVLASSQAAPLLILLGDPQQLDQPTQGSHPEGTEASALDHILSGQQTIADHQGLFLEQTWRLHPDVTAFISELFYEGKLTSEASCLRQKTEGQTPISGTGLRYKPVWHAGNQNRSIEEADAVKELVEEILNSNMAYTDRKGVKRSVTREDIIVIAPYNAQVSEIQKRLPEIHVGTVDKFQGQEAVIAIYSMTTSSHLDAPRGMEFLYSSNRLNVAISRAKCLAIMVASPNLFEAECKTPRQIQLANAFCRYLEMAQEI